MTLPDPLDRIYAGTAKIAAVGLDAGSADRLARHAPFRVVRLRAEASGGLTALAGDAELALTAPMAGPCVVACAQADRAGAETLLELWREAGLAPPELVELGSGAAADDAALAQACARAALAAHGEAAAEAVALDAQIAALREELEDARNRWQDCSQALQALTGGLPVLGYATERFAEPLELAEGRIVAQMLPYAGRHCRAFAVHVAQPGDGRLECRLVAQEDDTVLAQWTDLPAQTAGWITLQAPGEIPWRYRNLRFVLMWHGPGARAPAIACAPAAGMERYLLHLDGQPQPGLRAAMRVWTGPAEAGPVGGAHTPAAAPAADAGAFALHVGRDTLDAHVALVARDLGQWPWVNVADDGIMVHPTLARGPSVVMLELDSALPVQGVRLMRQAPHADAPPIAFLAAVYGAGADLGLDGDAPDPVPRDTALALAEWQELAPGTGAPLELSFAPRPGPVRLVLATRVSGDSVGRAHGWFRDIRLVCRV